jgi:formate/nitrite transporter FocA (FNT family)
MPSAAAMLVRQLGVQLQTQNVFYLTHIDPWYRHAVSRQKLAAYPVGCYMRNIISALYDAIPVS